MKKAILFISIIFSPFYGLFAQEQKDKFLKLSMHDGTEVFFRLQEKPSIILKEDSVKIISKDSYAKQKRSAVRSITFTTDVNGNIVNKDIMPCKYYAIRGVSGKYVNATQGDLVLADKGEMYSPAMIFYLNENFDLLNYQTGTYINDGAKLSGINEQGSMFKFDSSPSYSSKFILETKGNMLCDKGSYIDHESCYTGSTNEFTIEEITELPVTITTAKYATLYTPVALEIAEGVTAYTVTIKENWVELNEITDETIPAHTGVVLYSESPDTYYFPITATENVLESDLRGSVPATYYTEPGTYYALAIVDGEVGFYKDKFMNSRFQNNSHKAFIYMPLTSNIAHYSFRFDDETTGIVNVGAANKNNGIYDIQGRKINNIVMPGVYIVNGEKVLLNR